MTRIRIGDTEKDANSSELEEIAAVQASLIPTTEKIRAEMVVSRFQAKAALAGAGLLTAAETAVADADATAQLAWSEAVEFQRNSPTIAALAGLVGLDDDALDALFIAANQIKA